MLVETVPRLIVLALAAATWWATPLLRHRVIHAATYDDGVPSEPAKLPTGSGAGLAPTDRVRVVLVDGLAAANARLLPSWRAVCDHGVTLEVDVGFPTVSLPVEPAKLY